MLRKKQRYHQQQKVESGGQRQQIYQTFTHGSTNIYVCRLLIIDKKDNFIDPSFLSKQHGPTGLENFAWFGKARKIKLTLGKPSKKKFGQSCPNREGRDPEPSHKCPNWKNNMFRMA